MAPHVGTDNQRTPDDPECVPCPAGTECKEKGTQIVDLPLLQGYYRIRPDSDEIRRCPDAATDHSSCSPRRPKSRSLTEPSCLEWTSGPCAHYTPSPHRPQEPSLTCVPSPFLQVLHGVQRYRREPLLLTLDLHVPGLHW